MSSIDNNIKKNQNLIAPIKKDEENQDIDKKKKIENKNRESNNGNFIIGYIDIKNDNEKIKIINCLGNYKLKMKQPNLEDELKNCDIFINDTLIKPCYYYQLKNKGKYHINISNLKIIIYFLE